MTPFGCKYMQLFGFIKYLQKIFFEMKLCLLADVLKNVDYFFKLHF